MAGIGYTQVLTRGISFVSAIPTNKLGDRVLFDGNEYVYVQNRSSDLTAKQGYAMVLSNNTDYSCIVSGTTNIGAIVGVVQHVDIPVNEYGWILSKGIGYVSAGNNTGLAVNDMLVFVGTTNTGNLSRLQQQTVYSNSPTPKIHGVVQVATGTGGLGEALIF